ncbi:MAG: hypothetical protein K6F69_09570, partial [Treponema sp.]|nr:hypothetical protein [Treponema sp.]
MISSVYLLICIVWLIPLVLDIILLINKNRSLAWLFLLVFPGINFWGLLILFLVKPLKTCNNCKRKIQKDARVCPYCATAFGDVLKTQKDIKLEKRKQFKKIIFSIVGVLCICSVFIFAIISSCSNIFTDSIPYKQ